jgi:hypothetical protein
VLVFFLSPNRKLSYCSEVLEFRVESVPGTKCSVQLPDVWLGRLVKSLNEIVSSSCFFLVFVALDLCWMFVNSGCFYPCSLSCEGGPGTMCDIGKCRWVGAHWVPMES